MVQKQLLTLQTHPRSLRTLPVILMIWIIPGGLRETNVTVTGTRGGVQYPLQGQTPDSYANLGNGHVVVYGPEGRALYDVSSSRIKVVE